ncbi:hypothetical protein EBB79_13415 [Parasedimentitalea marina]|uniref:Fe2OG dioxygenase domain-containing protein n=1 Tax=Parasedimentitalea marina TaxID=2483033 RepID=A0A3T0N457_9RHOB|nr:hypothetical protein [Parasedimentitalea marina]AZV78771.1 hypothetical protein EBB79_13415 [Parasedimentitalea marina]
MADKINLHLCEGLIGPETKIRDYSRVESFGRTVLGGDVCILKQVFDEARLLQFRAQLLEWSKRTEPFEAGRSANQEAINFHRQDNSTSSSIVQHCFHVFGFGDLPSVDEAFRSELEALAAVLLEIQNAIVGTDFSFSDGDLKTMVARFPRGGGFQGEHRHPFLPYKILVCANMSRKGIDYNDTSFRLQFGQSELDVIDDFAIGDVLVFRADMFHQMEPVDQSDFLTWDAEDGVWILAIEALSNYSASEAV